MEYRLILKHLYPFLSLYNQEIIEEIGRQNCHYRGHSPISRHVFGNLGEEDFHRKLTLHDHRQRQKVSNSNSYINFSRTPELAIADARVKFFPFCPCYQIPTMTDSQLYARENYWGPS
jgi:hypothetical protein